MHHVNSLNVDKYHIRSYHDLSRCDSNLFLMVNIMINKLIRGVPVTLMDAIS